jgi:hypothetical protein
LAKSGMSFKRIEDAVMFAERQGWNWRVKDDALLREIGEATGNVKAQPIKYPEPKSYADNFTYSPDKLRLLGTK